MRHNLDPMHCKKNDSQSFLGFILGDKDTVLVQRDMEEIGQPTNIDADQHPWLHHSPEMHLRPIGGTGRFIKPQAPYALSSQAQGRFINLLSLMKTPTCYAGQLQKHIGQKRLSGLESHDFHVLVQ